MSLNVFIAICVFGMDFLIYVLFQWMYGDKRQAMANKLAAQRIAMNEETRRRRGRSWVSSMAGPATQERLRSVGERLAERGARETRWA